MEEPPTKKLCVRSEDAQSAELGFHGGSECAVVAVQASPHPQKKPVLIMKSVDIICQKYGVFIQEIRELIHVFALNKKRWTSKSLYNTPAWKMREQRKFRMAVHIEADRERLGLQTDQLATTTAAWMGDLHTLQWLALNGYAVNPLVCAHVAAREGHVPVLSWVAERFGFLAVNLTRIAECAISNKRQDVLQWARAMFYSGLELANLPSR